MRRWAGPARTRAGWRRTAPAPTSTGEVVSVVISQAAATLFIPHAGVGRHPGQPQHAEHGHRQRGEGRERGVGVDGPRRQRFGPGCAGPILRCPGRGRHARAALSVGVWAGVGASPAAVGVGPLGLSWWGWGGMCADCAMSDLIVPSAGVATRLVPWAWGIGEFKEKRALALIYQALKAIKIGAISGLTQPGASLGWLSGAWAASGAPAAARRWP